MVDIKITIPSHGKNLNLNNFHSANIDSEYKFHINSDIESADIWFVFEDLKKEEDNFFTQFTTKQEMIEVLNTTQKDLFFFFRI